jgi:hypothetical protein
MEAMGVGRTATGFIGLKAAAEATRRARVVRNNIFEGKFVELK